MDFIEHLKNQPRHKIIIGAAIVLGGLYMMIGNPHDQDYLQEVEYEIGLAKQICETSRDYVLREREKLRLDQNILENIKVNGRHIALKHVGYPKVLFFHTGYAHKGNNSELYCNFSDPRSSSKEYFYDYERKLWVPRTRTRR